MSGVRELYEVFSAECISKLKGFKVIGIIDGTAEEEREYISIEFIGPYGEKASLLIEDAVIFYHNELSDKE